MTGQNIKKYPQKELNLRCIKTDKTRNYIFSLPHNKSQENWTRKNKLIIDFGGQKENKTQEHNSETNSTAQWKKYESCK